jgi:hypothetical protein
MVCCENLRVSQTIESASQVAKPAAVSKRQVIKSPLPDGYVKKNKKRYPGPDFSQPRPSTIENRTDARRPKNSQPRVRREDRMKTNSVSTTSTVSTTSIYTDQARYHSGWVAVINEYLFDGDDGECTAADIGSNCHNAFMVEMVSIGKCMPGTYIYETQDDNNHAGSWKILWAQAVPPGVDSDGGNMNMFFQWYQDDFCQDPDGEPVLDSLGNYLTCDTGNVYNNFRPVKGTCSEADGDDGSYYANSHGYQYFTWPQVLEYPWDLNPNHMIWNNYQLYQIHHNTHLREPYSNYVDQTCADWNSDGSLSALLIVTTENAIPKYDDGCYYPSAFLFTGGWMDGGYCEESFDTSCDHYWATDELPGSVSFDDNNQYGYGYSNCVNAGAHGSANAFNPTLLCEGWRFFYSD